MNVIYPPTAKGATVMEIPPPSPWEMVLTSISQLRADMTQQLSALATRMDSFVSTETHRSDMRRLEARHEDLIADVGRERAERAEMRGELTEQIKGLAKALADERDARISGQRWALGAGLTAAAVAVAIAGLVMR